MTIAYVIRALFPHHGYGGLERAGTELMEHLLASGADIALFTRRLQGGQPLLPARGAGTLTVHTADYGNLPLRPNSIPARLTNYRSFVEALGMRVASLARTGVVNAIYAHGLCAWGVRNAGEWGVPLLANPHGLEEFKTKDRLKRLAYAPFRAWVRAGCEAADRVVATDWSMRDEVSRLLKLDLGKVVVLPNGVDLERIRSYTSADIQNDLIQRWPHLAGDRTTLRGISVGRLEPNKGFKFLLQALGLAMPELDSRWGWVLVGQGAQRKELETLSQELGLEGHVHFAGRLSDPDLHNLYELSSLFVHPTLYEGSSLVTLEAMAHGLPVVATRTGGIPDKVTEGQNGFLVPSADQAALARKIAWIAAHPQEAAEMGAVSLSAATAFEWSRIATSTKRVLEELVQEKASCRSMEATRRTP